MIVKNNDTQNGIIEFLEKTRSRYFHRKRY